MLNENGRLRKLNIRTGWLNRLLDVPSATLDVRRRARLLNILLLGIASLGTLAILAVFITQLMGVFTAQESVRTYVSISFLLLGSIITYVINRYWSEVLASALFLLLLTIILFISDAPYEAVWGRNLIMLAIPVAMASVILPAFTSFFMAGFVSILITLAAAVGSFEFNLLGIFAYFSIALVSWLSSRSLERAVQDLRTTNAELDQRVAQRTAELNTTNKQLEREVIERKRVNEALAIARDQALEASRLKSELLANISHELRTPLGAILGFAEMLRAGIYGRIEDRQRDTINKIIETNKALTALVGELLDQAQLESGKLKLQNDSFNPRDMIRSVQERLEVLASEKKLTLICDVASDIPLLLEGDDSRLQQIMINLVGNAIKFTHQGSVTISAYLQDEHTWAIAVKDTGPGIPKDAQTYIFDAFRQVDGSITRKHEGSGLGLSIVQQLTTLMNGRITLESTVGQGSVFTVILPLIIPAQEKEKV